MFTDHRVLLFGSLLLFLLFLHRIQRVKQTWQAFSNLPAYTTLVSPVHFVSRTLPRIPLVSGGRNFSWERVYERRSLPISLLSCPAHGPCLGVFAASHSDIVHSRSLFPRDTPQLLLADATAAKVGPFSEWQFLCSICPFRLSFKAIQYFLKLLET
jgi:hypothetical protein